MDSDGVVEALNRTMGIRISIVSLSRHAKELYALIHYLAVSLNIQDALRLKQMVNDLTSSRYHRHEWLALTATPAHYTFDEPGQP